MPLFINYKVKMFNRNNNKTKQNKTSIGWTQISSFFLKKEKEHIYFLIQIETFSWFGFGLGFIFSSASGKLFYLDLLSDQGRELCNNKCSIDWLYFYSKDGHCSFTEVSGVNHWKGTEKPVFLIAAYIWNYFSSIIV